MIELLQLTGDTFGPVDLHIGAGEVAAVLAYSEESGDDFIDTLLGLAPPRSGHVRLLGTDLYALPEEQRFRPLADVGVVLEDGGLISNLKVWENILLPAGYRGRLSADAEEMVVSVLRACAYTDDDVSHFLGAVPDSLTLREKRLAALLRLRLLDPALCIYDSLFDELDEGAAAQLARLVDEFHRASPARATLYTSARAIPVKEFAIPHVARLTPLNEQ